MFVALGAVRYVEQFDSLLDTLTVREMLLYTVELKSPHREPFQNKMDRVESVIAKLQLQVTFRQCKHPVFPSPRASISPLYRSDLCVLYCRSSATPNLLLALAMPCYFDA